MDGVADCGREVVGFGEEAVGDAEGFPAESVEVDGDFGVFVALGSVEVVLAVVEEGDFDVGPAGVSGGDDSAVVGVADGDLDFKVFADLFGDEAEGGFGWGIGL